MPMFTNSEVSYAKTSLPFPIWAAEFDPYNRGYLIVGGGGGESKTGVSNQIAVLDVSDRARITTAVDIDLSREEDSVSSLASLATKDGLIVFAGINSSEAEQSAGRNQHFRSFDVRYPPRKKQKTQEAGQDGKGEIKLIGKRSLLKPSSALKKETYQRILRLSPASKAPTGSKRIGAIASGLAKESEIIVFNATVSTPEDEDIITRINLPGKSEAADLDIALADTNQFSIAYCDDHSIYEQTIQYDFDKKTAQRRPNGPRRVHEIQLPDAFQSTTRSKYRSIRFLNPQNVLVMLNKPDKSGAELRVYHLYPTGPSIQVLQKKLPSHIKPGVSMDVCALDADRSGNQQFVVAVAGQDVSIELYTIDYSASTDTFSHVKGYNTYTAVHSQQMTKLCFAPFHSPTRATDEPQQQPNSAAPHPTPQYIRLASVSYGNTVVVDTFPLTPLDPQDKHSRYVLVHPNDEAFWRWAYLIVGAFVVLVTAFLAQSFYGGFTSGEGVFQIMPQNVREFLDQPARAAYGDVRAVKVTQGAVEPMAVYQLRKSLAEDWRAHAEEGAGEGKALVVRDAAEVGEVSVDVHDKEALLQGDASVKHWHELEAHQQSDWKEKLIKAGQWAEHEGESVLQGCLWGTYAGLVGQAAGEVLREL